MTKWEYTLHVVRVTGEAGSREQFELELNDLGSSGWEIVSVLPASATGAPLVFLKRQKAPGRLV
jgi:hypothetical protein